MVFATLSNIRLTKALVSSISTLKIIDIVSIWNIFLIPPKFFGSSRNIFFDPSPTKKTVGFFRGSCRDMASTSHPPASYRIAETKAASGKEYFS